MRAAAGASPLGDVNVLRRAGLAWSLGQEVDQFEAGLAVAGKARAFRALGRAGDGGACAGANRRGAGGGRQTGAAPRARPAKGSCQAPRFRAMIAPS
ncbi:MAG: hypothetical protein Q8Q63_07750 [Phaeovulum sp.]|uniref:hypothetical protein n=1 Tax=Phaeovulum sp. TaxID=2934796 RepID=UPI00273611F6|nr:hypothetical protein [Phaeovulum sp.]MDP3861464.1 hypothetical protein [Phaeovulum sp.]